MGQCYNCGKKNRVGELFCQHCGRSLTAPETQKLEKESYESVISELEGITRLAPGAPVYLQPQDAIEPIVLHPTEHTTIGRLDSGSPEQPDIDLTVYGALDRGVSRIHAAIERIDEDILALVDLKSGNGTYLNGLKLEPGRPHILHDGDEMRFGNLAVHIYFN